ncbi:MAG: glycosyltransferase [Armatimonadota bacterium]|nr:glycosyltransferase [bacterium]
MICKTSQQHPSIIYITNILSHHQLPVARELADLLGPCNFCFAVMEPVYEERSAMGWQGDSKDEPWILRVYKSDAERDRLWEYLRESDVAVIGCRDIAMIRYRIATGKLTFMMSERWWKPPVGRFRLFYPKFAVMAAQFRALSHYSNFHYLAMGHYAANDMAFLHIFNERMWRWGYFTAPSTHSWKPRTHKIPRIMWAGRMLTWKRVNTLLIAIMWLKDAGISFRADIIGDGPVRDNLIAQRDRYGLENEVTFHHSMKADDVRKRMRECDIYVLPSNGAEGWGAVVNEAMSEGCLVIACREAGSARVLIRDGTNGLLFQEDDDKQLSKLLINALTDVCWRNKLAMESCRTINELWCPSVAAQRLVTLSEGLMGISDMPNYEEGPCSKILL